MTDSESPNPIARLSVAYSDRPELRALLSLVPGWSAPDTLLQARAAEIRADRLRTFFDELAAGDIEFTEELVETEDFLHCYTRTVRAVENTRRREKIKLFARLLGNSMSTTLVSDPDDYEFLLSIVDELSLRELAVLQAIELYENRYYKHGKFSNENRSHEGVLQTVVEEYLGLEEGQLPDEELMGIVIRLNRTGCYTMMGWRKGPAKDCRLTDIYFKLKELVLEA